MLLPILVYPNPLLRVKCEEIQEITPAIKTLAQDMLETMYASDGIGLAAAQVGKSIRLIVADVSGPEERTDPLVLINPKITKLGDEVESDEGCLSVCDFRSSVVRDNKIRVEALDIDGKEISFEAEGLKAICLQHECDHLDGILFIDHISRLKRNMYDRKLSKKEKEKINA